MLLLPQNSLREPSSASMLFLYFYSQSIGWLERNGRLFRGVEKFEAKLWEAIRYNTFFMGLVAKTFCNYELGFILLNWSPCSFLDYFFLGLLLSLTPLLWDSFAKTFYNYQLGFILLNWSNFLKFFGLFFLQPFFVCMSLNILLSLVSLKKKRNNNNN